MRIRKITQKWKRIRKLKYALKKKNVCPDSEEMPAFHSGPKKFIFGQNLGSKRRRNCKRVSLSKRGFDLGGPLGLIMRP